MKPRKILWQGRSTNVFLAYEVEEIIRENIRLKGDNQKLKDDVNELTHLLDDLTETIQDYEDAQTQSTKGW